MAEDFRKSRKKIEEDKPQRSLGSKILEFAKEQVKPEIKTEEAPEANAAFGKPEDLLMAIPGGAAIGAARKAKQAENVIEYANKLRPLVKPLAQRAEQILIKGERAYPRLTKPVEVVGKLSKEAMDAMARRGEYPVFKMRKY